MYPNPVSKGTLYLDFIDDEEEEKVNYRIVNMMGQTVKVAELYNNAIDVRNLKSGSLYFRNSNRR